MTNSNLQHCFNTPLNLWQPCLLQEPAQILSMSIWYMMKMDLVLPLFAYLSALSEIYSHSCKTHPHLLSVNVFLHRLLSHKNFQPLKVSIHIPEAYASHISPIVECISLHVALSGRPSLNSLPEVIGLPTQICQ
jgi:hypothetical protein